MSHAPHSRWLSAPAAFLIALALALLPATPAFASAGMLDTGSMIQQASADDTRAQLLKQLDDQAVREKLVEMGVDPDRAQERVARLTPEELAHLEARMETDPAGAAGVVGVVAIVFVVLVILDAVGVTDIFSFVGPARER
ncbi:MULTISPECIES: PA2779 family protein [unclassified Thioalkalivibrio]|uniref:PA2779 family protein n=1 Tax=unclassified Thioalkalivibrio TaxID=2621013 RepID=UPI0003A3F256|nr:MULTISPECIES: PA2779 family protein [unclassified Thioalkalivibrio]